MNILVKIYLDSVFLVNFFMDYIVLNTTVKIMEIHTCLVRKICASLVGSVWAVVTICMQIRFAGGYIKLYLLVVTYVLISVIMILILLGNKQKRKLFKTLAVLYVVTFTLAGICFMLWNYMLPAERITDGTLKSRIILLGIALFICVRGIIKAVAGAHRRYGSNIYKVIITIRNKNVVFDGLIDTGNVLTDPFSGEIVHIVRAKVIGKLIGEIEDLSALHYRLIPFRSVGNAGGLLPVIDVDCMEIYEHEERIFKNTAVVGIYDGVLTGSFSYDALLNAGVLKK